MFYTDKNKIETQLGRDLTDNEEATLPFLQAWIKNTLDTLLDGSYGPVAASSKFYDGGYRTIAIDPVQDVTAVVTVDSEGDVYTEYEPEEYVLEPNNETTKTYIIKRYGIWPCGLSNIRVTGEFTLGDVIPDHIVYAATYMAGKVFSPNVSGDIEAETIEGYSRKYKKIAWDDDPIISVTFANIQNENILL